MSGSSAYASTRPLGVALLAVLIGIVGFLFVLAGLLLVVGIAVLGGFAVYGAGLVGGLIALIVGILLLVVASGLWDLEMWALALALLVVLFALALNLLRVFDGQGASVLSIAIELILVVYLAAVSPRFS